MENIRRYALFIALAVLSYFLLQAWNADYGQAPESQNHSTPSVASSGTDDGIDPPPAGNSSFDGIPDTSRTAANTSRFVKVSTDVLNLSIDLDGGDVEYLSLPKYPVSIEQQDNPFVLLENDQKREFILQSGLWKGNRSAGRGHYSTSADSFTMNGDSLDVVLTSEDAGVRYDKIYHFRKGDYLFDVTYRISNSSAETWNGRFFGQIKRDQSKDPSTAQGVGGMSSVLAFAWTTPDTRYDKVSFGDIEDGVDTFENTGGWVAFLQHYFLTAWIPPTDQKSRYFIQPTSDNKFKGGFISPDISVAPGASEEISASVYAGPKIQKHLAEIAPHLDLSVDYGWLWWAAQPIFSLLTMIQKIVVNWGWSIILLTICIKTLLYPLTASSYRSMAKMKKFGPKMQELREQFGDDRQKMSQEMMKLYQKEKINPMGGCLPMVIQMPIFIALYWSLMEAVELRQEPWILWIHDLSIKDPYFILPILLAGTMFFQMQMTSQANMDPTQAKMMKFMPLIFGVMFLWFPSGLVLYYLANTLITIFQQWFINRQIEKKEGSGSSA